MESMISMIVTIRPNGQIEAGVVRQELEVLQERVGGFIECIASDRRFNAFCNEEGKRMKLPPNPMAQFILMELGFRFPGDVLVGPVVFGGPTLPDGNAGVLTETTAARIVAIGQQLFDPAHFKDETAPCPACGARWASDQTIDHSPGCLYIAVSVAGL